MVEREQCGYAPARRRDPFRPRQNDDESIDGNEGEQPQRLVVSAGADAVRAAGADVSRSATTVTAESGTRMRHF